MAKFITKRIDTRKPQKKLVEECVNQDNNKIKKEVVMTTDEKVAMAQNVLKPTSNTKRIKKDKGLIERTESSKTILTDDNKDLFVD